MTYIDDFDILHICVVCTKILGKCKFYVYLKLEIRFRNNTLDSAEFGTLVYLE